MVGWMNVGRPLPRIVRSSSYPVHHYTEPVKQQLWLAERPKMSLAGLPRETTNLGWGLLLLTLVPHTRSCPWHPAPTASTVLSPAAQQTSVHSSKEICDPPETRP